MKLNSFVLVVIATAMLSACGAPQVNYRYSGGGSGDSGHSAPTHNIGNGGPATPQERVDAVYGNDRSSGPAGDVGYTNTTTTATAGSGGQQQAGDNVPSRDVEQSEFSGEPAGNSNTGGNSGGNSGGGNNVTENGNVAPDIF